MEQVVIKNINNIKIGYGGKALGNTQASYGQDAEASFAKFKAKFPGKTVFDMPAVGGGNILDIDGMAPSEAFDLEADALITKQSSVLLTLRAADCIPLVFYVPGQNILALAHVGTSGAALHLPRKVIEKLGFDPDIIHVYFGPTISQKSYRFTEEEFEKKLDSSWDGYITHKRDGVHINLLGYVLNELKNCGITDENIKIENVDTGSDHNYFSHRRHKLTGEPNGRNVFGVCLI